MDIIGAGGKPYGGQVGLGHTKYHYKKLHSVHSVSEDVVISGFRAGDKERFYGYLYGNIFNVLDFDPNHDL